MNQTETINLLLGRRQRQLFCRLFATLSMKLLSQQCVQRSIPFCRPVDLSLADILSAQKSCFMELGIMDVLSTLTRLQITYRRAHSVMDGRNLPPLEERVQCVSAAAE
ncbi:uncharacterized protein V6R79_013497 [Siganus canaliculatus]